MVAWDREGTNEYRRVLPSSVPSVKRQADALDGVREFFDAALAVLLGFGGVGFVLLFIGKVLT